MRIVSSQVQAQSQHALQHSERHTSVRRPLPPANNPAPIAPSNTTAKPSAAEEIDESTLNSYDKELSLLKALVEAMTGKRIETASVDNSAPDTPEVATASAPATPAPGAANNGRELRLDLVQISETEITEVSFSGQFSTADGQQLSLDLQFTLQRSYAATTFSASVSNPVAKDPLVLNFDGLGARLSPALTQFDLNSDGTAETLPTLAPGSAYLAIDRNGDGRVANGSELFGPTGGDGFVELAALDDDGNGFIDSGDRAFDHLFAFRPGEALATLAQRDIGAIFLGSIVSPARLTDSNNQSLGQLRASSFYLTNQGSAGLVQQLDLVV